MSGQMTVVNFGLSSVEYTQLWLKVNNKQADEEFFKLVNELMHDHSKILKAVINCSNIKLSWSDSFGEDTNWDEDHGKKE
jgi:hypothetical protein|tara:strand:- start:2985 stop:3224 length:240 start_codon:yes stop_codon:yes gene_type:complete